MTQTCLQMGDDLDARMRTLSLVTLGPTLRLAGSAVATDRCLTETEVNAQDERVEIREQNMVSTIPSRSRR